MFANMLGNETTASRTLTKITPGTILTAAQYAAASWAMPMLEVQLYIVSSSCLFITGRNLMEFLDHASPTKPMEAISLDLLLIRVEGQDWNEALRGYG